MIEFVQSDLNDRKQKLIRKGIKLHKDKNAEWYELLAFDKLLIRKYDNFFSVLQDYLLNMAVEAASQVLSILENEGVIEFILMQR